MSHTVPGQGYGRDSGAPQGGRDKQSDMVIITNVSIKDVSMSCLSRCYKVYLEDADSEVKQGLRVRYTTKKKNDFD